MICDMQEKNVQKYWKNIQLKKRLKVLFKQTEAFYFDEKTSIPTKSPCIFLVK